MLLLDLIVLFHECLTMPPAVEVRKLVQHRLDNAMLAQSDLRTGMTADFERNIVACRELLVSNFGEDDYHPPREGEMGNFPDHGRAQTGPLHDGCDFTEYVEDHVLRVGVVGLAAGLDSGDYGVEGGRNGVRLWGRNKELR